MLRQWGRPTTSVCVCEGEGKEGGREKKSNYSICSAQTNADDASWRAWQHTLPHGFPLPDPIKNNFEHVCRKLSVCMHCLIVFELLRAVIYCMLYAVGKMLLPHSDARWMDDDSTKIILHISNWPFRRKNGKLFGRQFLFKYVLTLHIQVHVTCNAIVID